MPTDTGTTVSNIATSITASFLFLFILTILLSLPTSAPDMTSCLVS
ncbi:MAG: hypothetical protein LBL09_03965 [Oscillospiraceae bacterium]|nr:hypothetical protein [Oscillospiraceae bacterium]